MNLRNAAPAVLFLLLPGAAPGAAIDDSKPLLCAITEAVECTHEDGCSHGAVTDLNFPPFIWVDRKAGTLREHRGERKSKVATVLERDGSLVLQGYENRAYSISISKETGQLSATAAAEGFGFVLFGVCTNP